MRFSNNTVTLGKGRVCSARVENNGDTGVIMDAGGALVYKKIPYGARQPVFSGGRIISYGDDCFRLDSGRLERRGGFFYVPD
jgi:hypothetical protein